MPASEREGIAGFVLNYAWHHRVHQSKPFHAADAVPARALRTVRARAAELDLEAKRSTPFLWEPAICRALRKRECLFDLLHIYQKEGNGLSGQCPIGSGTPTSMDARLSLLG